MTFRLGTVEGFFGRQWSWQARRDHADFLASQQFTTYLYAPKNDVYLRKHWAESYPETEFAELRGLARHASEIGLEFGVGLSPFELYRDFSAARRDALLRKLDQLNELQAPLLAVLFDDMLGDLPGLADTQLAIFDCIRSHSSASHFMLCPTYYSDDPLLVKHFGRQPEHYLEQLGQSLPLQVDVFWTGPKVISHAYPRDHLLAVGERLRRKPLLWDNYPVNDAKRLTSFLHLFGHARRGDGGFQLEVISQCCSGLLANPMNQAYLSQIPLRSLGVHWQQLQGRATPPTPVSPVLALLAEDSETFQLQGLERIDGATHASLQQRYRALLPDPMAQEVCDWLDGKYAFDPDCLT